MSTNQRNDIAMLLAAFALSYFLYYNAGYLSMPITIIGALLVVVILIKVARNDNVS